MLFNSLVLLCNAVEECGEVGREENRVVSCYDVTGYACLFLLRSGENFLTNISRSLQTSRLSRLSGERVSV